MWCLALLRQTWSTRLVPSRECALRAGQHRPVRVSACRFSAPPSALTKAHDMSASEASRTPPESAAPPVTPDGRYLVVRGRLWRRSYPALPAEERDRLVHALMQARRGVRDAFARADAGALRTARADVQAAKVGLGERGPVWWDDGAPDWNRYLAKNTPYAAWWAARAPDHAAA